MTAPTKFLTPPERPAAPRGASAGLLLPGVGHVLGGELAHGLPMLLHLLTLLTAAVMGAPRLGRLLFPAPGHEANQYHAWLGLGTWIVAAIVLWYRAWRYANPRPRQRAAESEWQLLKRQFSKHRMGILGVHGVFLLFLLTMLTPFLAPFSPDAIDVGPKNIGPCLAHLAGTDEFGRDLLSRLLFGARISLSIGFIAVGISATFGSLWGATSGFFGGRVDSLMMWCVDFLLSLPRLVLVITIVGLFRPTGSTGLYLIVAVLGLTGWMGVSRIVRGLVLSLREQDFVQAARAIGQTDALIVTRHLLPNAIAPIIVHATLGIGDIILTEATLSFLGLGVPPPTATWGSIVNDGREFLRTAWWIATFPGLLIVFAVTSFNLLGDGLRDALDPKLRNR